MARLIAQGRTQGSHTITCLKTFVMFVPVSLRHRSHVVTFCDFCDSGLLVGREPARWTRPASPFLASLPAPGAAKVAMK
jgi:hypothetical protein